MKVTWYGNASILLEAEREKILFDPFIEFKGGEHRFSVNRYAGVNNICITHGHLDHLSSLPDLIKAEKRTVYCTQQAENNLLQMVKGYDGARRIEQGKSFRIGNVQLTALKGKHINFDKKLMLKTGFNRRTLKYFPNILRILSLLPHYRGRKEVSSFLVEAEQKKALVMGSLGLDEQTTYPSNIDVFICPFQGNSDIENMAEKVILKIKPKSVVLDHFDDAFPPMSSTIETTHFATEMNRKYRDIHVITPTFGQATEF
jgi:L-ascorbate metabolism protein UlaG (beta-lactamase superfamily)